MSLKATTLATVTLAAGLAVVILQPAAADPYSDRRYGWRDTSDIRRDIGEVQRDRRAVATDEANVAHERAEQNAARARERAALNRGDVPGVVRNYEQEQREARELAAAERKLAADRQKLAGDRREVHREIEQRRRWWWWG